MSCLRRPSTEIDSPSMDAEYVKAEFLEGRLVQQFKVIGDTTPSDALIWIDASTGAPVHYTFTMQGQNVLMKFSGYSIFIDESEFNVPKRLVCQDNTQLFDEMTAHHFMKHPTRLI